MNYIDALAHKIRKDETLPLLLSVLLRGLSVFQRLGMWKRLHCRRVCVDARVISFGNLTAGGAGKTPAVIERALREISLGHQVAVITRGYGAAPARKVQLLPPGANDPDAVKRFGDEALLIARRVPGVWIVRSANRVKGAKAAIEQGCDTLLLDDGYQAVSLERDENILLIDGVNPFGNGCIIPRGLLREPLHAMSRATEIVVTRCDQTTDEALYKLTEIIRMYNSRAPLSYTVHKPLQIQRLCDGSTLPLSFLQQKSVQALCGIGNPEAFFQTLENLGARREQTTVLADHQALDPAAFSSELPVVMTEKDAVRLGKTDLPNLYALTVTLAPYG